MTWNGSAVGGTYTYSTTGDSPGDPLTLAVQLPSTSVVEHDRPLPVERVGAGPGPIHADLLGHGLRRHAGRQPLRRRLDLRAHRPAGEHRRQRQRPAGMLRIFGSGEYSFYTGTSTFSSPADDAGVLSLTGGTYTYTAPDGETETFNSGGYETQWTSADGNETLQFRYNGSNQLTGMTAIDGGLSTFSYSSGLLSTIQTVNSRTTTFAYSGVNLTQITTPTAACTRSATTRRRTCTT